MLREAADELSTRWLTGCGVPPISRPWHGVPPAPGSDASISPWESMAVVNSPFGWHAPRRFVLGWQKQGTPSSLQLVHGEPVARMVRSQRTLRSRQRPQAFFPLLRMDLVDGDVLPKSSACCSRGWPVDVESVWLSILRSFRNGDRETAQERGPLTVLYQMQSQRKRR